MATPRIASVFADPPVYAAGHAARLYSTRGAATRGGIERRMPRFFGPALYFLGGAVAGTLVAVAIARAVLR
jgi:hypothetical protein